MQSKIIKNSQQIRPLIKARFLFIALQLIAIFIAQFWLELSLPFSVLYSIVLIEVILNFVLFKLYRKNINISVIAYFSQVSIDIVFLTALLYFSGGASNPFVSLLLLPIAIASVTLPKQLLLLVTLFAISAYSGLLLMLSPHDLHHMNMQQHLLGMWFNFILSAIVVVLVVASLIKALNKQEKLASKQREEQLRQEQLLSLGTAAAQFAHRLATPLATVHLVSEELQELQHYDAGLFSQLDQQLTVCRRHLDGFRAMAEQVKKNEKQTVTIQQLITDLREEVQLSFPRSRVNWQLPEDHVGKLIFEPILMPALLNLIQNAVLANEKSLESELDIYSIQNANDINVTVCQSLNLHSIVITIRDHGAGFADDTLLQLGSELVDSKHGLGMGVFLSHVTLDKLGGQLKLFNHQQGGAVAEVTLPLLVMNNQHNEGHVNA